MANKLKRTPLWIMPVLVLLTFSLTAATDGPPLQQLAYLHSLQSNISCSILFISDVHGVIQQQFDLPSDTHCAPPIWSPDGNYIALWSPNIRLINVQTGSIQTLTDQTTDWRLASYPLWSRTGKYMAWREQKKGSIATIRWNVIYIPNGNIQTFSNLSDVVIPDDIQIVEFRDGDYYIEQTAKPAEKVKRPEFVTCLTIMESPMDQLVCVTESAFFLIDPTNRHNTHKVDKNKNPRIQYPLWSPDRSQIVYPVEDTSTHNYWLEIASSDGSNSRRLTTPPDNTNDGQARWSSDNQYISFLRGDSFKSAVAKIYIIKVDGSDLQYIGEGLSPIWRLVSPS